MYKIVSVLLLLSALAAPALSQRKKAVKAEPGAYTVKGDAPAKAPAASFTAPRTGITVERYTSSYDIREDGTARSRGKTAKAAEHLLTSIRAPLRKSEGHFTGIDFRLAKELFRKGEHKAVIEFLKQNLELESFKEEPEVYKTRIDAIRAWISQAEKGIEPSFDFEKTAAKK